MAGTRSPIFSFHNGICLVEEHNCKIQYPIKAQVHLLLFRHSAMKWFAVNP